MRRKDYTESLPWNVKAILAGLAVLASLVVVFIAMTVLKAVLSNAMSELSGLLGNGAFTAFQLPDVAWLLAAMAFLVLSVNFYTGFRKFAVRKLQFY